MAYGGARRLSGRALLGGFGLLALAFTLGVLAVLALRVLDASPITTVAPELPDASTPAPLAGPDVARTAACDTNRSALELAGRAYTTLHGSAPADQSMLVAAGLLGEEVETHRLELSGAEVVIIGLGDCADS